MTQDPDDIGSLGPEKNMFFEGFRGKTMARGPCHQDLSAGKREEQKKRTPKKSARTEGAGA